MIRCKASGNVSRKAIRSLSMGPKRHTRILAVHIHRLAKFSLIESIKPTMCSHSPRPFCYSQNKKLKMWPRNRKTPTNLKPMKPIPLPIPRSAFRISAPQEGIPVPPRWDAAPRRLDLGLSPRPPVTRTGPGTIVNNSNNSNNHFFNFFNHPKLFKYFKDCNDCNDCNDFNFFPPLPPLSRRSEAETDASPGNPARTRIASFKRP